MVAQKNRYGLFGCCRSKQLTLYCYWQLCQKLTDFYPRDALLARYMLCRCVCRALFYWTIRRPFLSSRSYVRPDRSCYHVYLMNGLSNLGETYREYSLVPTDELVIFWRSKVKGQKSGSQQAAELAKASMLRRRSLSSSLELKLL